MRRICELHRQGQASRTIASQLDREGIPARRRSCGNLSARRFTASLSVGLITLPRRPPEDEETGKRGKRKTVRDKPTAIVERMLRCAPTV